MGYGEVGILSPSANAFRDPTSQRSEAVGQGMQRASYLSSMDQFYAQLGEAARQFDLNYGIHERAQTLAESHDVWAEDVSREGLKIQREGIASQERLGYAQIESREDLGFAQLDAGNELGWAQLGMQQEQMDRDSAVWDKWGDQYAAAGLDARLGGGGQQQTSQGQSLVYGQAQPVQGGGNVYGASNNWGFSAGADDTYDLDYGQDASGFEYTNDHWTNSDPGNFYL